MFSIPASTPKLKIWSKVFGVIQVFMKDTEGHWKPLISYPN